MRRLDGIIDSVDMESEQTVGNSEGQGSLACCLNNSEKHCFMRIHSFQMALCFHFEAEPEGGGKAKTSCEGNCWGA